jgi:L-ascorbate metabolism protein UlaG (beta-lactamase superfamily)
VPLRALLLRRQALPDPAMLDRYATAPGAVAGVLVGHTHFDHAVDAPAIARRFNAKAYGSESLVTLMRLHGLEHLAVEVAPHKTYELGPFAVRFVPSRHSKLLFGRKVPMDGELTCDHLHGLVPTAYKCGAVWGIRIDVAGIRLYHQGSANLDDDELPDEPVDVFLAGVAGRSVTPRYWQRILPRLDPGLIVPTHYDDFFAPLDSREKFVRGVKLTELPDEIAAVSSTARLAALPRIDHPALWRFGYGLSQHGDGSGRPAARSRFGAEPAAADLERHGPDAEGVLRQGPDQGEVVHVRRPAARRHARGTDHR